MPGSDHMRAISRRESSEDPSEGAKLKSLRSLASPGLAQAGYRLLVPLGTGGNSEASTHLEEASRIGILHASTSYLCVPTGL